MKKFCYYILVLMTLTPCLKQTVQAQSRSGDPVKPDSLKLGYVEKMQAFAKRSAQESSEDFAADKVMIAQVRIFEQVKQTMQQAKAYLRAGIDTVGIKNEISEIRRDLKIAGDGVLVNRGSSQTFRNLTASSKIISELLSKAKQRKLKLDQYKRELTNYRYQMDSLISLNDLFKFPNDSVTLASYLEQIRSVAYEVNPVDSALKLAASSVQKLSSELNLLVSNLSANLDEIEFYQQKMAKNSFGREFNSLWNEATSKRPFSEIFSQAKAKGLLTLKFYVQNNFAGLLCLILLISGAWFYLSSLKAIYRKKDLLTDPGDGQLVLKLPLASATIVIISLFQFLFFSPPFILNFLLWTISSVCLTLIFKDYVTRYWMLVWLIMVGFFVISAMDNMILQASRSERWFMFVLALSGVITGILILTGGRRDQLRERLILIAITLMIFLEAGSAMANALGRYNLSKALLISGYLNVVIAIQFLWTLRLINEGMYLAFHSYTHQDPKLFYLNYSKIGQKVPTVFYLFLILGWIILFGRNFSGFNELSNPLRDFFIADRTIGDYTFSINGLLLFAAIMGISVIISKIVSFFAADHHIKSDKSHSSKKEGIGSWLLLVRIFILSSGLFLAIAATGFPIDKITIVLGALGVGVGFGLQTLVNNLVSGLIIAFEKPVNVGDIVELDGQAGTVKSIGFRSSIIATWEGANVVLPNGDLLNAHLTNWSLDGNKKRLTIPLGVAYQTDLEFARKLLTEILVQNDDVLKNPAPSVQYEQFGESAIEMKILLWVRDFKEAGTVKNDLIMAITASFRENKIEIPYPKKEIYLQGGRDS